MIKPFTEDTLAQSIAGFGEQVHCSALDVKSPPLFVEARADRLKQSREATVQWFEAHRDVFERALIQHGAVVLRGFPLHDTDDFIALIAKLPKHEQGYAGGTQIRKGIKAQVLEASTTARDIFIHLHQEMSYLPNNPRIVAFYCKKASETGGGTVIADMRRVTQSLPQAIIDKLEKKGVRYTRNLRAPGTNVTPGYGHNTWSSNFGTESREEVENMCKERNLRAEWLPDGGVNLINETPAMRDHPVTGDRVYFNQLHLMSFSPHTHGKARYEELLKQYRDSDPPFNSCWGDGERLTTEELDTLYRMHLAAMVNFPWKNGDVMFVENRLTAHGRDTYTGTRDVQVALID